MTHYDVMKMGDELIDAAKSQHCPALILLHLIQRMVDELPALPRGQDMLHRATNWCLATEREQRPAQ